MGSYVLGFQDIDRSKIMLVGGKGANLGELARIDGIRVPDGFCVTTAAFERAADRPSLRPLLDQLALLKPEDRDQIAACSAELRRAIAAPAMPDDMAQEITRFLARLGDNDAYAIRSSATAEDSPAASFAGQHDTYLNVTRP